MEIRPLFEVDDFGDEMTPELRDKEERLRAELEGREGAVEGDDKPRVRTCLWFDGKGEEAAEFYTSLVPDSAIETATRPEPGKPAMVIELSLAGTPYMFLNGGAQHKLSPAASIVVRTADQAETDRLWSALLADGGEEGRCAWLTDRFGVSWQIVPDALPRLLGADDREAAGRAMQAMLHMTKINIAALESAFHAAGEET